MAVFVNSDTDYLTRKTPGGNPIPGLYPFTICGWAKREGDTNNYSALATIHDVNDSDYVFMGTNNDGSTLIIGAVGRGTISFSSSPAQGEWFFWAFTTLNTTADGVWAYWAGINDNNFYSEYNQVFYDVTTQLSIFTHNYYNDYHWPGRGAAVKVWTNRLTQAELQKERWSYVPQRFNDLYSWSPLFDDAWDYSGKQRHWDSGGIDFVDDGPPILWCPRQSNITYIRSAVSTFTLFKQFNKAKRFYTHV